MIDIKNIREQQSSVEESLRKRDKSISLDGIVSADLSLRELTKKLNDLQSDQNQQSKDILSMSSDEILSFIGLKGSVSSQRTNGFSSAVNKIQGIVK